MPTMGQLPTERLGRRSTASPSDVLIATHASAGAAVKNRAVEMNGMSARIDKAIAEVRGAAGGGGGTATGGPPPSSV
jgi:hypothetical protein